MKPTLREIEEYMAGYNMGSPILPDTIPSATTYDTISKPKHYMLFEQEGIEVRDVLEKLADKCYSDGLATQGSSLFISDYVQLMQYLMRFMDKNGVEDLKKARWYLDKMISSY